MSRRTSILLYLAIAFGVLLGLQLRNAMLPCGDADVSWWVVALKSLLGRGAANSGFLYCVPPNPFVVSTATSFLAWITLLCAVFSSGVIDMTEHINSLRRPTSEKWRV